MSILINNINKNVPIPLYYQLKEMIMDEINNGNLNSGDSIPTELELSDMCQISRTTIRQAVTELVNEGYLYRVKGKGTFVSKPKIDQDFIRKLENFNDQIKRRGMVPHTKVLCREVIGAENEIASTLKINAGDKVIHLIRLRFADDEPNVICETYISYNLGYITLKHDMEHTSLYDLLSENPDAKVYKVIREVEAKVAGPYESNLLKIRRGDPIQYFKTIGFNVKGIPVEFSMAKYRGDRNKFTIEILT